MKKLLISITLLLFLIRSFGQHISDTTAPKVKTDYLQKSKKQKTAAWVLLGGGVALIIAGSAVMGGEAADDYANDPWNPFAPVTEADFDAGEIMVTAGIFAGLGSIPFFIASGKNKRKAASLSLNNMRVPQIKNSSMVYRPMPAVSLKINL